MLPAYVWVYGGLSPPPGGDSQVGPRGSGQCFEYPERSAGFPREDAAGRVCLIPGAVLLLA